MCFYWCVEGADSKSDSGSRGEASRVRVLVPDSSGCFTSKSTTNTNSNMTADEVDEDIAADSIFSDSHRHNQLKQHEHQNSQSIGPICFNCYFQKHYPIAAKVALKIPNTVLSAKKMIKCWANLVAKLSFRNF